MKFRKRLAAAGLSAALAFSMVGCASGSMTRQEAESYIRSYVQGTLDSCYLDRYSDEYLALVGMTADEARASTYDSNVAAEAETMLGRFGITGTDANRADMRQLVKEIYAHSRYEVSSVSLQDDGSFDLTINVEPMDILTRYAAQNDVGAIRGAVVARYGVSTQAQLDSLDAATREALENEYGSTVISGLRALVSDMGYEPVQAVSIHLQPDGNAYNLVAEEWERLDSLIIAS